jgi:hypothetical protein
MKSELIHRSVSVSLMLLALSLGAPAIVSAQESPGQGQSGYRPMELMTAQSESFALGNLLGKPLRGSNQEEFTTLSDFLIDPRSGRVHFAMVHSGSNTHRLVPMRALRPGTGTSGLVVALDRAAWDRVGTMTESQLQGRIFVDAPHQHRLQQQFALSSFEAPVDGLVRASTFRGRELRANNEALGVIDDVVIDFHNKIAAPVIRTASRWNAPERKVLVHFPYLQVSDNNQGAVMANLDRGDFRNAWSQVASSDANSNYANQATGGSGSYFNQGASVQPMTASTVQQAIDRDASLPRGSVQAVMEPRIVLRGTVPSDQKRQEMERAAQQAAPGVRIENQINVRSW